MLQSKLSKLALGLLTVGLFSVSGASAQETELELAARKACASANPSVCASLAFQATPSVQNDSAFILTLSGVAATAVQDLRVDVWMDMGGHGHGSAPVEITNLGNNRYQVKNVWFVMEGTWQIRVWLQSGGRQLQIQIPVTVQ